MDEGEKRRKLRQWRCKHFFLLSTLSLTLTLTHRLHYAVMVELTKGTSPGPRLLGDELELINLA